MNHLGLFEGIGGFSLAARWMGWNTVAWCEINEFCQKILKHHFPNAIAHGDIKTTDFSVYRGLVDIVTGGFPCQPYSQAGKRKGNADDRHLWPEMLRAAKEIQPTWIVGENVLGLLSWRRGLVLAGIKSDLEVAGFEVFPPIILPACGKNAPHRRDRLWIVAYSNRNGESTRPINENKRCGKLGPVANSHDKRLQRSEINRGINKIREERKKQFIGSLPSDWQIFPTQSPFCGGNDGISNRVDRTKALGNAIVPQIAYELFKAIESINNTTNGLD